jgi:4-hydroxybenzoate polyprenyltransferase
MKFKIGAYGRLMRVDKPIGLLLLWFPTAWALWLANRGLPPLHLIVLFALGTFFMRSAGCVVNDMADRKIDLHVSRTERRPLATGELTLIDAFVVLMLLLLGALGVLLALPWACVYYAVAALGVTILYPFCKRFLSAPQLILGIAFSMGIPMAYVASGIQPNLQMGILFVLNLMWIVAYDTMYAMVDRTDDLRIGVKSTAILFAQHDCFIISILQVIFHGLWLMIAMFYSVTVLFYPAWFIAAGVLIDQQRLLRSRESVMYFRAFLTNGVYGLLMWIGVF